MSTNARSDFIERARRDRHELAGIDLALPSEDLAPLAGIVGDARIVGLGESWHHAHQLLKLKFRIVRYLVEHLGFDTLVFEGSLPGGAPIDAFVRGSGGSAGSALHAFGQPMWLNPETVEFVEWLRIFNARAGATAGVRIFGMDIGYPAAAIFAVLAYLDRVDVIHPIAQRELVADIGQRLQAVRFGSLTKSAMYGSSDVYDSLSPATRDRVRSAFVDIIARLQLNRAGYTFASSPAEYDVVLRYAVLSLQAHDAISVRSSDLGLANDVRDLAFAENVHWIAGRAGGDARIAVLAHNGHVSRDPFKSRADGPAITSMGGHLARWYARDYVPIGTSVGRGRIRGGDAGLAARSVDDEAGRAFATESVDAALEEVGCEHFILDVPSDMAWAQQSNPMRSHLDPQPHYVLANAFDAVTYLDKIVRAGPIAIEGHAD